MICLNINWFLISHMHKHSTLTLTRFLNRFNLTFQSPLHLSFLRYFFSTIIAYVFTVIRSLKYLKFPNLRLLVINSDFLLVLTSVLQLYQNAIHQLIPKHTYLKQIKNNNFTDKLSTKNWIFRSFVLQKEQLMEIGTF